MAEEWKIRGAAERVEKEYWEDVNWRFRDTFTEMWNVMHCYVLDYYIKALRTQGCTNWEDIFTQKENVSTWAQNSH